MRIVFECFQGGYKYNALAGYGSAISTYHDPILGIPIRENEIIFALLSGIFNKKPAQPEFNFIWYIVKVLDFYANFRLW